MVMSAYMAWSWSCDRYNKYTEDYTCNMVTGDSWRRGNEVKQGLLEFERIIESRIVSLMNQRIWPGIVRSWDRLQLLLPTWWIFSILNTTFIIQIMKQTILLLLLHPLNPLLHPWHFLLHPLNLQYMCTKKRSAAMEIHQFHIIMIQFIKHWFQF